MDDRRKELEDMSGGNTDDRRRVSYSLGGPDLDPDQLTKATGINPDFTARAGTPRPRTGLIHDQGIWLVDSGLDRSAEFHQHIDSLLARLTPAWGALVEMGQRFEADVDVAIHLAEAEGPVVVLLPDAAAKFAELNASVCFDLYADHRDGD
jgi:Domain of unknown function (DUF4279)